MCMQCVAGAAPFVGMAVGVLRVMAGKARRTAVPDADDQRSAERSSIVTSPAK